MPKKLKIKTDRIVSAGDIPDDVEELELECEEIADSAFQENGSLKKLTLTNVEKVGEYAFYKCKELNTIVLNNVTAVGKRAFDHCHKLTAAHLDCKTIGRDLFWGCPNDLNDIMNDLLDECLGLRRLCCTIKDDIYELELDCGEIRRFSLSDRAITQNRSLNKLTLIGADKTGEATFWNCDKLTYASLDCKKIGKDAFHYCSALETVSLLNTEEIGENAFEGCESLKEIKLPDTLRKIDDNAFFLSGIQHLAVPPSVTEIGEDILDNDDIKCTIEVYLKNGVLPFKPGVRIAAYGTLLIVRSFETNEILCRFILFGSLDNVFTEHGIDFTEYDKKFKDTDFSYYNGFELTLRAARIRLHDPVGMNEETFEFFKDYVSEKTKFDVLLKIISGRYTASDIAEYPYFDDITDKHFTELIDYSAHNGTTGITALLMQKLHERGGGNAPDLEL